MNNATYACRSSVRCLVPTALPAIKFECRISGGKVGQRPSSGPLPCSTPPMRALPVRLKTAFNQIKPVRTVATMLSTCSNTTGSTRVDGAGAWAIRGEARRGVLPAAQHHRVRWHAQKILRLDSCPEYRDSCARAQRRLRGFFLAGLDGGALDGSIAGSGSLHRGGLPLPGSASGAHPRLIPPHDVPCASQATARKRGGQHIATAPRSA